MKLFFIWLVILLFPFLLLSFPYEIGKKLNNEIIKSLQPWDSEKFAEYQHKFIVYKPGPRTYKGGILGISLGNNYYVIFIDENMSEDIVVHGTSLRLLPELK